MKKQHIATIRGNTKNYHLQRLRMGQDGKLFVLPEDKLCGTFITHICTIMFCTVNCFGENEFKIDFLFV